MLGVEFLLSGIWAALICLSARSIAAPVGLLDLPDSRRKQHSGNIPLLGGLAVLPGLVWSLLAADAGFIVAISLFYFALGMLDDMFGLSARVRLVLGALVILLMLQQLPQMVIDSLSFFGDLHITLGIWALPFTCICILGFVNAINMIDGVNGLLVGLSTLWASFLLMYATPYLTLSFIGLFAALITTLAFNLRGKVFLGDSGAYMLGAAIAATAIWVYNLSPVWQADGVALLFVIPVIDCLRVMAARILAGKSPMTPDLNHLHHLLNSKWPKGVLLIYWSLVGAPNFLAFCFPGLTPIWLVLCLSAYFYLVTHLSAHMRRPVLQLAETASSISDGNDDKST